MDIRIQDRNHALHTVAISFASASWSLMERSLDQAQSSKIST